VQGCFLVSIAQAKVQCFVTGDMLISKLNRCFVDFKLMNALGIVYPQIWMELDVGSPCILMLSKNIIMN
jgi:hypothetical protein